MPFGKRQNDGDRKQINGSWGLRADRGVDHKSTREIWGLHKELFCVLISVVVIEYRHLPNSLTSTLKRVNFTVSKFKKHILAIIKV